MARNSIETEIETAIEAAYPAPAHILACASAIRYDLYHGPCFARIPANGIGEFTIDDFASDYESLESDLAEKGGRIEETYTGIVADTLRAFIADLPSELWYDSMTGELIDSEPEGFEDEETGEWIEPDWTDYYRVDSADIVKALFGKTISREFN